MASMQNADEKQNRNNAGWLVWDGDVLCDGMSLEHLRKNLQLEYGNGASPVHVYSHATLVHNVCCYLDALTPLGAGGVLAYSLKANSNPRVVEALREAGVERVTCISGNEMKVALCAGFLPSKINLNGNGKLRWEVEEAVRAGSLLNVDSLFDARQVVEVAGRVGIQARLLLRLNPAINAGTHPYLSTALADSKFGVEESQVKEVLDVLRAEGSSVKVEGVHVHLGSAITDLTVYAEVMHSISRVLQQIHEFGWPAAMTVNLGGGLSAFHISHRLPGDHPLAFIDSSTPTPTPEDLVNVTLPLLPEGATLMLEPGRSLVATAGVLMTEVLGVKTNGGKVFVVVDAAMSEVIRPALYGSRHHMTCLKQPQSEAMHEEAMQFVDVVGPVCESGDFLARQCPLPPTVTQGDALLMWTTGAYCASMASNYNMRPHALEVMVHGPDSYKVIRRPQNFDDLIRECQ